MATSSTGRTASPIPASAAAKINGTGANNNFITGLESPVGVAVDSKFIYWTDRGANQNRPRQPGRHGVKQDFITADVTTSSGDRDRRDSGIYWVNQSQAPRPPSGTRTSTAANPDGGLHRPPGHRFLMSAASPPTRTSSTGSDGVVLASVARPQRLESRDPNFVPGADFSLRSGGRPAPSLYWATDSATTLDARRWRRSRGRQLHPELARRAVVRAASPSTRNSSSGATHDTGASSAGPTSTAARRIRP